MARGPSLAGYGGKPIPAKSRDVAPYTPPGVVEEVVPEEETEKPPGFISSLKRGTGGLLSSTGRSLEEAGLPTEEVQAYGRRLTEENPATVTGPGGIVRHPLKFLEETAGELIPPIVAAIPSAYAGGKVGAGLGALTSPVTGPAGPVVGATIGAAAGAFFPSYLQSLGHQREQQDLLKQDNLGRAAVAAVPSALLDTGAPIGRFTRKLVTTGLEKGGLGLVKDTLLKGGEEGLTEVGQDFIEGWGASGKLGIDPAQATMAFAKGFVGGAAVGAVEGVVGKDKSQNRPEEGEGQYSGEQFGPPRPLYGPAEFVGPRQPKPQYGPTSADRPQYGPTSADRPQYGPTSADRPQYGPPAPLHDQPQAPVQGPPTRIDSMSTDDLLAQGIQPVESRGRSGLVSPKGALGLHQVLVGTGRQVAKALGLPEAKLSDAELATKLRHDDAFNTTIAREYLNSLRQRYNGDAFLAVHAYHAGPGNVDKWTRKYGYSPGDRQGYLTRLKEAGKVDSAAYPNLVLNALGETAWGGGGIASTVGDQGETDTDFTPEQLTNRLNELVGVEEADADAPAVEHLAEGIARVGPEASVDPIRASLDKLEAALADPAYQGEEDQRDLQRKHRIVSAARDLVDQMVRARRNIYTEPEPVDFQDLLAPKPPDPDLAKLGEDLALREALPEANKASAISQAQQAEIDKGRAYALNLALKSPGGLSPSESFAKIMAVSGYAPDLTQAETATLKMADENFRLQNLRAAATRPGQAPVAPEDTTLGVEAAEPYGPPAPLHDQPPKPLYDQPPTPKYDQPPTPEYGPPKPTPEQKPQYGPPKPPEPPPTPQERFQAEVQERADQQPHAQRGPVVSKWFKEGVKAGLGLDYNDNAPAKQKTNFEIGRRFAQAETARRDARLAAQAAEVGDEAMAAVVSGVEAAVAARESTPPVRPAGRPKRQQAARTPGRRKRGHLRRVAAAEARRAAMPQAAKAAVEARPPEPKAPPKEKPAEAAPPPKAEKAKPPPKQPKTERGQKAAAAAGAPSAKAAPAPKVQPVTPEQAKATRMAEAHNAELREAEDKARDTATTRALIVEGYREDVPVSLSKWQAQLLNIFADAKYEGELIYDNATLVEAVAMEKARYAQTQDPDIGQEEAQAKSLKEMLGRMRTWMADKKAAAAAPQTTETVVEPAQPVAGLTVGEAPPLTKATKEQLAPHLTEDDKKALAAVYKHAAFSDKTLAKFTQDFVKFVGGVTEGISRTVQAIAKRIQPLVLAIAVVFNPMTLNQGLNLKTPSAQAQATATMTPIRTAVPADARSQMSATAIGVYESQAALAKAQGSGFFIADKPNGVIHVFAKDGSYVASSSTLYGAQAGDVLTEEQQAMSLDEMAQSDKITPAGTFVVNWMPDETYTGGGVLMMSEVKSGDIVGGVSIHAVYMGNPKENRPARLASPTTVDNKVSSGCINTTDELFLKAILPHLADFENGLVFVLPDTVASTQAMFPATTRAVKLAKPKEAPAKPGKPALPGLPAERQGATLVARRREQARRGKASRAAPAAPTRRHEYNWTRYLRAQLDLRGLADVKLVVTTAEKLAAKRGEADIEGYFTSVGGQRLIEVALDADNPLRVLDHEVVHALKDKGVIRPGDWAKLTAAARADADLMKQIREQYPNLTAEEQIEEAVAEMFAEWSKAPTKAPPAATGVMARIRAFFAAIKRMMAQSGFDTAEQAMQAMHGGRLTATAKPTAGTTGKAMYAGVNALSANLETRHEAERLANGGAVMEQVRRQTGWHRGEDGKWRFEISDKHSKLKDGWDSYKPGEIRTLGEVLDHPALFKAYPTLIDMPVIRKRGGLARGWFDGKMINVKRDTPNSKSTLLHEIQHAVQDIEGFAQGGDTTMFTPENVQALAKLRKNLERRIKIARVAARAMPGPRQQQDIDDIQDMLDALDRVDERSAEVVRMREDRDAAEAKIVDLTRKENALRTEQDRAHQQATSQQQKDLIAAKKAVADARANLDHAMEINADAATLKTLRDREAAAVAQGKEATKEIKRDWTAEKAAYSKYSDQRALMEKEVERLDQEIYANRELSPNLSREMYRLLTGEIEARDTAARRNLSDDQRRDTTPEILENIRANEKITVFGLTGRVPEQTRGKAAKAARASPQAYAARSAVRRSSTALAVTAENMAKKGHAWMAATEDLANMHRHDIPSIRKLVEMVSAGHAKARALEERVSKVKDIYHSLPAKLRGAGPGSVSRLLYDMTISGKWAFTPDYMTITEVDPALAKRFNEIKAQSPKAAQMIEDMLRFGHDSRDQMAEAYSTKINAEFDPDINDPATSPEERKELRAAKERALGHMSRAFDTREGLPYLPLVRDGWWAVVGKSAAYRAAEARGDRKALDEMADDPDHHFVDFRDNVRQAEALHSHVVTKFGKEGSYYFERNEVPLGAVNDGEVFLGLDRVKKAIAGNTELGAKAAARMNRMVTDLYLHSLAETSARKAELRRKGTSSIDPVTGETLNMVMAFASRGQATANFIASITNGPETNAALFGMQAEVAKLPNDQKKNAQRVVNEVMFRYATNQSRKPNRLVDRIVKLVSAWTLLSTPFYYLQNATQHCLIAMPLMASQFGYGQSAAATWNAYRYFTAMTKKSGLMQRVDFATELDAAELQKLGINAAQAKEIRELLDFLALRGRLDAGFAAENGKWELDGEGIVPWISNPVMRFFRMAPQFVEVSNRVATGVSTYQLAKAKLIKGGMSEAEAAVQAREAASKMIYDAHGDYSGFNSPTPFQRTGDFGRIALQFRKFQFIQGSLLAREFHRAFFKKGPDRVQGIKALGWISAHMMAVGGILGQPAAALLGPILGFIYNRFDDDDDKDYQDWREDARVALGAGGEGDKRNPMADFMLKGAPYALLGMDTHDRLGMGMVAALSPYTNLPEALDTKENFFETMGKAMLGPSGGILSRAVDGWGFAEQNDWTRAAEVMMPGFLGTTMKAARLSTEGLTDSQDAVLLQPEKLRGAEFLMTAGGVRPRALANQAERRTRAFKTDEYYDNQTTMLKRQYRRAVADHDAAGKRDAIRAWDAIQAARVRDGIKRQPKSELLGAVREQAKRQRQVIGGVPSTPANRRQALAMLYAQDPAEAMELMGVEP